MAKLHELSEEDFCKVSQTRRSLIAALEKKGFSRWDMDQDGNERFMKASPEEIRTISFDENLETYAIK